MKTFENMLARLKNLAAGLPVPHLIQCARCPIAIESPAMFCERCEEFERMKAEERKRSLFHKMIKDHE